MLKSTCVSCAMSIVKITVHRSSGYLWLLFFVLVIVICSGHSFLSQLQVALVPIEGGVGSSKCAELPVILKPSFQWEGVNSRGDDTLVSN